MPEREMSFSNEGGGKEAQLTEEQRQAFINYFTEGLTEEVLKTNSVAQHCEYRRFISNTKGVGRKRKFPVEVELFKYNGRWRMIFYGSIRNGIDSIATEVLGDSVPSEEATEVFLNRLRKL